MNSPKIIKTDVLVVGGGMAGLFAAIKAKEAGAETILADKGYASSSGQTPFANSFFVFDPETDDYDSWMHQVCAGGDYVNNRDWTDIVFKGSKECYEDLIEYGASFYRDEEGNLVKKGMPELGPSTCIFTDHKATPLTVCLRRKAERIGVRFMDRVMMVSLLKNGSTVVGAAGITVTEADPVVFWAKSVVLCTGASALKPYGWPVASLTGDGDMMAYRAGAGITGKEFMDPHTISPKDPAYFAHEFFKRPVGFMPPLPKFINSKGETHRFLRFHLGPEFEAHKGNVPVIGRFITENPPPGASWPSEFVGGASNGMSGHRCEGLWPVGTDCSTELPGLFAAGDSLGQMLSGAAYSNVGIALTGAGVTGALAGKTAAANAAKAAEPVCDDEQIKKVFKEIYAPMDRQGGYKPAWVIQNIQNVMFPYFIAIIKKADRLEATLTLIEFYRDHLVPRMRAEDPHELRLAIEARNMVLNAEMKLRAALMRQESRGTHYREDFPDRDDENWFAWIKINQGKNGEMVLEKVPIKEEWKKPAGEEYMYAFPRYDED